MGDEQLIAGEIIGWRAWGVVGRTGVGVGDLHGPLLLSLFSNACWPRDDWLRAECFNLNSDLRNWRPCEKTPGENCHCGIYAARDRAQLVELRQYGHQTGVLYTAARPLTVIGQVGLAGRMIPGSRGWRAARGRVLRLWVPFEHWRVVKPLEAAYGVPVKLSNTMQAQEGAGHGHRP